MKRVYLLFLVLLSNIVIAQNTSPLVVRNFSFKSNEIIDLEQIPKFNRTDLDNNPICRIKVKAVGFEEDVLQKVVFIPNGFQITHMVFKDGMWYLHVSSHRSGELEIKYMGECVFKLPYQLEPNKVYELTLGMETATLIINALPSTAEIYVDGAKIGTGYGSTAISVGSEHHYKVTCNEYIPEEDVVITNKIGRIEKHIELKANFGYITIKSNPSGADVFVDEQKVGITPYQLKKIQLGQHVVELRKTGYETYADVVNVKMGEVNKQLEMISLNTIIIPKGILDLNSEPTDATIIINGKQYGKTPLTIPDIEVGTYVVYFTKGGYENFSKIVEVKDSEKETVAVVLTKTNKEQPAVTINNTSMGAASVNTFGNGSFSVSLEKKVYFAKGNLQYQASTQTWRFAENPWDIIGDANKNISSSYSGWIDLFGWGTGRVPTISSIQDKLYMSFNDWGKNVISNGDGKTWRTLTKDEWVYVFNKRNTASGVRYAKAVVNGVNGVILLPDNWDAGYYHLKYANIGTAAFMSNEISLQEWNLIFKINGAIFLPAAGSRTDKTINNVGVYGYYWSSTTNKDQGVYRLYFYNAICLPESFIKPNYGQSVRLVYETK